MNTNSLKNQEAELSLITILLQKPELIVEIDESEIVYSNFNDSTFGDIYQTIKALYCEDINVEPTTIYTMGRSLGFSFPNKERTTKKIQKLFKLEINVKNIYLYVNIIRDLSFKRKLIEVLEQSIKKMLSSTDSLSALEIVEGGLYNFVLENIREEKMIKLTDGVESTLKIMAEDPIRGLTTGFPTLDKLLGGGCRPGSLNLICASTGVGKSLVSMHCAIENARKGVPVLYLDNELGKEIQTVRFIGALAGIPFPNLEDGSWMKKGVFVEKYKEAKELFDNLPIYFIDSVGMSNDAVISVIRRFVNKHVKFDKHGNYNKSMVIYDYFRVDSIRKNNEKEYEVLGQFAAKMHDIACQYKTAIFGTAQLNRSLSIAGSQRLMHPADSVIYFLPKSRAEIFGDQDNQGDHKFTIEKARFGPGTDESTYVGVKTDKTMGYFSDAGIGKFIEDAGDNND